MYQPVLISSGLVGWQFLQRTHDQQFDAFNQSPELKRDTEYFSENIKNVRTAEDLVSDRRMLTVALGAFGLQDDIDNRFFIQKMLSDGTTADDALANRFTDSRYRDFSAAFGLGPGEIRGALGPGFADEIIAKFQASSFEIATGNQDDSMRVALYAERVLPDVVNGSGSAAQKWFSIMGQPPLRNLFETAFGLPEAFGQADIDFQLGVFRDRASRLFGISDPSQISEPETLDRIVSSFLARSQLEASGAGSSSAAIALTLLQS